MRENTEIDALIQLLDDPDPTIYGHVEEKLKSIGQPVIPVLESAWETQTLGVEFQSRVEKIIHTIQFEGLKDAFAHWKNSKDQNLLEAIILIAKYQYPELDEEKIHKDLEKIEQDIWIELNNNLTALEQIRVINHVLYDLHNFSGNTSNYHDPKNSFINIVLETKKGNPISLSIIYMIIAQRLKLPVFGVNLPRHFVLAYCGNDELLNHLANGHDKVMFYINPFSQGGVFSKKEIDQFIAQLKIESNPVFTDPCDNLSIVSRVLNNLHFSYTKLGYTDKVAEIEQLQKVVA